jgi:hypothetical protein
MPPLQESLGEHLRQSASRLKLLGFKPMRKGSLRSSAEIRLPNGLIINDVVIGESDAGQWALLPSKAMIDRYCYITCDPNNEIRYAPVCEWAGAVLRKKFSERVALVKAEYPTAFVGGDQ